VAHVEFTYRASTAGGEILRGVERGPSRASIERALVDRGLLPLEVEAVGASRKRRPWQRQRRLDVIEAIHNLATLSAAGFTLERALGVAAGVASRADVAAALGHVRTQLRAGADLAAALAAHPRQFPPVAVGMVRAGLRGGDLSGALADLAAHLEAEEELRQEVVSALVYPALLAVVGGVALLFLLLYVLPRLAATLGDLGAGLPTSTMTLLRIGDALRHGWIVAVLLGVLGAAGWAVHRRSSRSRAALHAALLTLPVIGPLRQRGVAVRFGRMLAALLRSGMPVPAAMEVAAEGISDIAAAAELRRARARVEAGTTLAEALDGGRALPRLFVQMVEVGEESGQLPELMSRGAASAERELRRGLTRAVRLIEPVFIVLFGLIAGLVALGLLQTIYGLRVDGLR